MHTLCVKCAYNLVYHVDDLEDYVDNLVNHACMLFYLQAQTSLCGFTLIVVAIY